MGMMRRSIGFCLFLLISVTLWPQHHVPVTASKAMVVAQEPLAVDVGVDVLRHGGNAVDAAVATAFALSVTYPFAGNLGGGGFMLIRMADGRTSFIDFREVAPKSASRDMFLDDKGKLTRDSMESTRASGVPGTVRGLDLAHKKFGRKPWIDLVRPSVSLARDGFVVSYELQASLAADRKALERSAESKRIFLRNGDLFRMGDTLKQPDLASTLERIAAKGASEFYEGETAAKLAAFMGRHGGVITLEDLKSYQAVEREPLRGNYKGYTILTAPPPSSGGVGVLQMAKMLEGTGYEKAGEGSAAALHYLAEVQRRYYADRSEFLADPAFFQVPVDKLLNEAYISKRRASIDPHHASTSAEVKPGGGNQFAESDETTHLSVIDAEGNAVSMTYTLNGGYGSGITAEGLGFLLNNEMDDFAAKPGSPNMFGLVQGEANRIEPGKRPLSSMTPTIVLKNDKPYLVLGAPGGGRIINGVFEVMLNVLDFHMNIAEAIDQPRVHHQWQPDTLNIERGVSPDTVKLLEQMGYQVRFPGGGVALVQGIMIDDQGIHGAHDRRGTGKAAGF